MTPDWLPPHFLVRWGRQARAAWLVLVERAPDRRADPGAGRAAVQLPRGAQRTAVLTHLVRATLPQINSFLVLSALVSLVLIRIVVATAMSYGLSQYALEVLVRTLVLELIPLYAAMFVALRYALPGAQEVRRCWPSACAMGEPVDHQPAAHRVAAACAGRQPVGDAAGRR
jgi:phospholipid/cholesterol/gamma-HCH transport system permease protein